MINNYNINAINHSMMERLSVLVSMLTYLTTALYLLQTKQNIIQLEMHLLDQKRYKDLKITLSEMDIIFYNYHDVNSWCSTRFIVIYISAYT